MKKIISQKTEPKDTSVIWLDTNTQQLKMYNNGKWVTLGTDNDSIAKLISNGNNPIQVQFSQNPTENELWAPFTPVKESYLYLPGYRSLYNVIEISTRTSLTPKYEFNNGSIYLLEAGHTYHIMVLDLYEMIEINPEGKIYYCETIGQNVIIDNISECVFSYVDNSILFYRNESASKDINYNPSCFKVGSKINFSDCKATIVATHGSMYDGEFVCEPVTIYSSNSNKFIKVNISGQLDVDGILPICTLSFDFGDNNS